MITNKIPILYTTPEVARMVGISRQTVNHHAAQGRCGRFYGNVLLYTDKDVEWLEAERPPVGYPKGKSRKAKK